MNKALKTIRLFLFVLFFLISIVLIGEVSNFSSTERAFASSDAWDITVDTPITDKNSVITVTEESSCITFSADNSNFDGKVTFSGEGSIYLIIFANPKSVVQFDVENSKYFEQDFCVNLYNECEGETEITYDLSEICCDTIRLDFDSDNGNPALVNVICSDSKKIFSKIYAESGSMQTTVNFTGEGEINVNSLLINTANVVIDKQATVSVTDNVKMNGNAEKENCSLTVNGRLYANNSSAFICLTVAESGVANIGSVESNVRFYKSLTVNGSLCFDGEFAIDGDITIGENATALFNMVDNNYLQGEKTVNDGTLIFNGAEETKLYFKDFYTIENNGLLFYGVNQFSSEFIDFYNYGSLLAINRVKEIDFYGYYGDSPLYLYLDYYDGMVEDFKSGKIGDARVAVIPTPQEGLVFNGTYQTALNSTFQYTVTNGVGLRAGAYVSKVSLNDSFFSWEGNEYDHEDKIIVWYIAECTHDGATTGVCPLCGKSLEKKAEIVFANVAFQENVFLLLAVKTFETQSVPTLNVWTEIDESYSKSDEDYFSLNPEVSDYVIDGEKYYIFVLRDISAKQLADDIAFSAEADGMQSDVLLYSVLEYTLNTKAKPYTSMAQKALIDSVLDYAATSQKFFGYNTDRLANDVYYRIKLTDCTFADGTTSAVLKANEWFTVYAPYEQVYFSKNGDNYPYPDSYYAKFCATEDTYITAYKTDDVKITVLSDDLSLGRVDIFKNGEPVSEIYAEVLGRERVNNGDGTEITFSGGYVVKAIPNDGCYFVGWENFTYDSVITEPKTIYALFSDKRPTAVLEDKTLTFYYKHFDEEPQNAYDIPYTGGNPDALSWNHADLKYTVNKIVIDKSFRDYPLINTRNMFKGLGSVTVIEGIENLNMERVISAESMFEKCSGLEELDLSSFNTENLTNMKQMFYGCTYLKELDLSGFDTSKVKNMYQTFSDCFNLESIDLSFWDTSRVTNMDQMFMNCTSLTCIDLTSFTTASLTDGFEIFAGAESLRAVIVDDCFAYSDGWYPSNEFSDTALEGIFTLGNKFTAECARLSKLFDTVYYYSEEVPTESGVYWHYGEDGLPEVWLFEDDLGD